MKKENYPQCLVFLEYTRIQIYAQMIENLPQIQLPRIWLRAICL